MDKTGPQRTCNLDNFDGMSSPVHKNFPHGETSGPASGFDVRGTELYVDTLRHRFAARRIVQLAAPTCLPPSILITPESGVRS